MISWYLFIPMKSFHINFKKGSFILCLYLIGSSWSNCRAFLILVCSRLWFREDIHEYSNSQEGDIGADGGKVELVYVEWDTEIASTHVVGKVLEDLGYDVELTPLDNAVMWEAVATGEADGMVAAWLPGTHGAQMEQYGDQVVDLGPNLEGAKIGLVVPSYMDVNSIADLSEEASQVITGIEPGAGVVAASERALDEYENLDGWVVQTSSSGAMATALGQRFKMKKRLS